MERAIKTTISTELARSILYPFFRIFYRIEYRGKHNIPTTGALVVISNHPSYYDPLAVAVGIRRLVNFMAWDKVFGVPPLGWFLRKCGAFPVDLKKPDKTAFKKSLEVLSRGGALGIFPEGGRSYQRLMSKVKPGAAILAIYAKAVILPVAVLGSFDIWPRTRTLPKLSGKIVVEYLPPIYLDLERCENENRTAVRRYAEEVTERVVGVVNGRIRTYPRIKQPR